MYYSRRTLNRAYRYNSSGQWYIVTFLSIRLSFPFLKFETRNKGPSLHGLRTSYSQLSMEHGKLIFNLQTPCFNLRRGKRVSSAKTLSNRLMITKHITKVMDSNLQNNKIKSARQIDSDESLLIAILCKEIIDPDKINHQLRS